MVVVDAQVDERVDEDLELVAQLADLAAHGAGVVDHPQDVDGFDVRLREALFLVGVFRADTEQADVHLGFVGIVGRHDDVGVCILHLRLGAEGDVELDEVAGGERDRVVVQAVGLDEGVGATAGQLEVVDREDGVADVGDRHRVDVGEAVPGDVAEIEGDRVHLDVRLVEAGDRHVRVFFELGGGLDLLVAPEVVFLAPDDAERDGRDDGEAHPVPLSRPPAPHGRLHLQPRSECAAPRRRT